MSVLRDVLVRFGGAPDDQPAAFYKDLGLSLVAALALLIVLVLLANAKFTIFLFAAALVVLLCFSLAKKPLFVGAAVTGIACMRFCVAFVFSPSLTSLLASLVLGVAALILVRVAGRDAY
jgi:hypothetical protein